MKIGVCFKIVPDFEEVPIEEWSGESRPDFTYVKKMYGCFDEAALETALCLKDSCKQSNMDVETVAVTAGAGDGAVSESLLRGLFAAGFDDVVLLPEMDPFDPESTARALAQWFRETKVDLIFTGRSTGPNDSGLVPYYLARELNLPIIGEVTSAKWEDGVVLARKASPDRFQSEAELSAKDPDSTKADLPCVVTVGDSDTPVLRLFPLKARMDAQKKTFTDLRGEADCRKTAESATKDAETTAQDAEADAREDDRIIRGEKITDANCQMMDGKEAAEFLLKKISEVRR